MQRLQSFGTSVIVDEDANRFMSFGQKGGVWIQFGIDVGKLEIFGVALGDIERRPVVLAKLGEMLKPDIQHILCGHYKRQSSF